MKGVWGDVDSPPARSVADVGRSPHPSFARPIVKNVPNNEKAMSKNFSKKFIEKVVFICLLQNPCAEYMIVVTTEYGPNLERVFSVEHGKKLVKDKEPIL